jgi:GT2 family glycosyltransferase
VEKLISLKKDHPEWGIIGPLVFNPDGSLQLSWGRDLHLLAEVFLKYFAEILFRWLYRRKKGRIERNVDWVSGACFVIERSLYREVGGFDENFFLYSEDADLGKRVRAAGHKIRLTSDAHIIHHAGKSVAGMPTKALLEAKKSQLHYYCKHNGRAALALLKLYLRIRFRWKQGICMLKQDKQGQKMCQYVLTAVREFRCENPV